ncbi:MAG: hypothetical protein J5829_02105 [Lachnospiraceae bacterium]|nr:hypothetical protein [Lachnospiraceae bacterium]
MSKRRVRLVAALVVFLFVLAILLIVAHIMLNKYSVPQKEERLKNLEECLGIDDLTNLPDSYIANDIEAALSKYTNWDNLFLSENFKNKYKNRKNILENVERITRVTSGISYISGEPVVIIFAENKRSIFDRDESDCKTTEYYFKYLLNEEGEIDDLILLEKRDVYTINGEPVRSEQ